MIVFQSTKGRVIKLLDAAAQCKVQLLGNVSAPINYETQSSIITRIMLSQRVNVQFSHMIGTGVYIYVFGDRIGEMTLSGLSFTCACPAPGGTGLDSPGMELMYNWYKTNRASKKPSPLRITIGKSPIEGFLTQYSSDVVDPASGLSTWNAALQTLPDDT